MRTQLQKVFLTIAVMASMAAASVALLPPMLWGDHVDYQHVASIKDSREYQDRALLAKAWALPAAVLYRTDLEFQRNVSFCGPTSIVNVLHSLHRRGDQTTVLDGTGINTVLGYLPGGVTLDQLATIASQKVSAKVTVLRDLDVVGFREHLQLANDTSRRYVINFSRGALFGTGAGIIRRSQATSSTKTWCSYSTSIQTTAHGW